MPKTPELSARRWFKQWQQAEDAQDVTRLESFLDQAGIFPTKTQLTVLREALQTAQVLKSSRLLSAIFKQLARWPSDEQAMLRGEALAVMLELRDSNGPDIDVLFSWLSEGERIVVLGLWLEAMRLDPDPERRLVRLNTLIVYLPTELRSLYWLEAQGLALRGGDDAKLLLLGFVRHLPAEAKVIALQPLRRVVQHIQEPFKKAMAFEVLVTLADSTSAERVASQQDARYGKQASQAIPDAILRHISAHHRDRLGQSKDQD